MYRIFNMKSNFIFGDIYQDRQILPPISAGAVIFNPHRFGILNIIFNNPAISGIVKKRFTTAVSSP